MNLLTVLGSAAEEITSVKTDNYVYIPVGSNDESIMLDIRTSEVVGFYDDTTGEMKPLKIEDILENYTDVQKRIYYFLTTTLIMQAIKREYNS